MQLEVCLATQADISDCNELHNKFYGISRTLEQWDWTFDNGLLDLPELSFIIVRDGEKLVGTQALIPIQMVDQQGVYWTAKSEETLVEANYRGQQLSGRMYNFAFEFCTAHNIASIWGFTPARKALERAGFEIPAQTAQLIRPLRLPALSQLAGLMDSDSRGAKRFLMQSALMLASGILTGLSAMTDAVFGAAGKSAVKSGNLDLRDLAEADDACANLCRAFVEEWGGTTIYRDAKYLNWRIFSNRFLRANVVAAYHGEELLGWCAFSEDSDGVGYIIDIVCILSPDGTVDARECVGALLSNATKRLRDMGASSIRAWSMTSHKFDLVVKQVLLRQGFYSLKRGNSVVLYRLKDSNGDTRVQDFSDWSVTRIYTEGRAG